ncbi:hypothetical protein QYF61_023989 [Mycteria americana]|uniref:Uncharacterized protein n=1 Tax=Mycteria americana TaxID=33587 RepID=A0AAN7MU36_MYCAM|nr:hypothetical protein QYF61_023989 [Mycteria americana]
MDSGWGLNHFPGQPVPVLDNPFSEVKFPHIQSKPPLAQLEAISSRPITCYLGEETDPHLSTPSFQAVVESDEVSPQPPFLQAEQPQGPQPLPISLVLQTLPQLRCPSLDTLQPLNVSLGVGGPTPNTAFEVRPHQCRVQGHDHCPSPAGHTISDTSQDAIGFLGHLGTLLAHIQATVNQHPQVLLCQAAFQPLLPKPVALHGVAVAQVPLQSLPILKQINAPTQLGVICKLTEGALDPFIQIIDKDIKQNWPQHRALENTTCDRPPAGVNSIHHHSLGPAIQPVLYPVKSTPVQAMSSQFLQENAVGNHRHRGTGNGGCGQFITRCLCRSFLLRGRTPHTLPLLQRGVPPTGESSANFSNVSPSHRLQFFTNCSSVGPFHRVQSFRSRLLQRGSPTGSQVLPENLLQHGFLSPRVHRSCQEPVPVRASHGRSQPPSGIHLLWRGVLHGLQWRSAPPWTSMGCRGTACFTMVFTRGCRGISASVPGAPPPPPSSLILSRIQQLPSCCGLAPAGNSGPPSRSLTLPPDGMGRESGEQKGLQQMHNLVLDQHWEIVKPSHHKDFQAEILYGEAEQRAKPKIKGQGTQVFKQPLWSVTLSSIDAHLPDGKQMCYCLNERLSKDGLVTDVVTAKPRPFTTVLTSMEAPPALLRVRLCPVVGLLEPAGTGMRQPRPLLRGPRSPHSCQRLGTGTWYNVFSNADRPWVYQSWSPEWEDLKCGNSDFSICGH